MISTLTFKICVFCSLEPLRCRFLQFSELQLCSSLSFQNFPAHCCHRDRVLCVYLAQAGLDILILLLSADPFSSVGNYRHVPVHGVCSALPFFLIWWTHCACGLSRRLTVYRYCLQLFILFTLHIPTWEVSVRSLHLSYMAFGLQQLHRF